MVFICIPEVLTHLLTPILPYLYMTYVIWHMRQIWHFWHKWRIWHPTFIMSGFGSMGVKRCDRITGIQTNANWLVNMYHFVIFVPFQFSEVIRVDAETCFLWYIMKINIATLRSNLGISTLLEILQTCKLDHKVAWFDLVTTHPTTQPPTARSKILSLK